MIITIKSVHIEEVCKMFAIDASEHLEADEEYHLWLNVITEVNEVFEAGLHRQGCPVDERCIRRVYEMNDSLCPVVR